MKAGIYHGIRQVAVEQRDKPAIGPRDVLIQVTYAGICGTDIGAYLHGGDAVGIYPGNEFGHEFVGIAAEVGAEVQGITKGMRLTINPTDRRSVETSGMNTTEIADMAGAFSQYVYVENARLNKNVFHLPDTLPDEIAMLTEPLSVSMHAVNLSQAKKGDKVLVYGAGTIGLSAVAALKYKGVTDIIVSDINDFKLSFAEKLGAVPFNSNGKSLPDFVKQTWGTLKGNASENTWNADVVLDCAGAPQILQEYMDNAKTNSTFVEVAINMQPSELSLFWLLAKEAVIKGSRGYTPEDILQSIDALNHPDCKLKEIITHTFSLEELPKAFEVGSNPNQAVKVAIKHSL
ncbi:MAG TPA: zinc-binding dehydrogenase [Clostridia bacterium]|jgi:threonine dehydrogenase-like Zn-dependent dehydrogenase|nr:zinc-binding dehydrogenase [Clostridia bacterium]HPY43942.1 zinc-binding dehydrogenase [Clostridia bacterium]HQA97459.1 zinc-binding dehydrogenase [Clostridia bacterium]HQO54958.1 zinc-binding dehydrogenase [Clostridia bacterium]HUM60014.1 zinc-binding dehydrogenase [Clostridia bacterium]